MKISVVIIFCDKDFSYLNDMTSMIEKFVTIDHEIILVDNRDNQVPFETKYKVVSKGHNCYIFEGRRMGLDAATGDYIWFVDVDDEIVGEVSKEVFENRTENILQLSYLVNGEETIKLGAIKNNIACFGPNVWSRIYKTSVLREALKPLRRDINLVNGEDRVIFDFMISQCKSPKDIHIFSDKYRYNYLVRRAAIRNLNQETIKRGIVGDEELDYIYSFLPEYFQTSKKIIKDLNNQFKSKLTV